MRSVLARTIVRAWQLCETAKLDIFDPEVVGDLESTPGWGTLRLPRGSGASAEVNLGEAMRALELNERSRPREAAEARLVCTLPGGQRGRASIRDVAQTLVAGARREILVIGYTITDASFADALKRRGVEGVSVTVVADRSKGAAKNLLAEWPEMAQPLIALHEVEPDPNEWTSTHAKVLVADREEALISSANFTYSGFSKNFEMGVHIKGAVAAEVCQVVADLAKEGWLEPAG